MENLTKEQKQILTDLFSPDENIILSSLERIRNVGGEYCISPMMEIYFTTPFEFVRTEIESIFLDIKSKKVSKIISESLKKYSEHKLIGSFLSSLWQSAIIFEDISVFIEIFVNADGIVALDCVSIIENSDGNINPEIRKLCRAKIADNYSSFADMKKSLAQDLLQILDAEIG